MIEELRSIRLMTCIGMLADIQGVMREMKERGILGDADEGHVRRELINRKMELEARVGDPVIHEDEVKMLRELGE